MSPSPSPHVNRPLDRAARPRKSLSELRARPHEAFGLAWTLAHAYTALPQIKLNRPAGGPYGEEAKTRTLGGRLGWPLRVAIGIWVVPTLLVFWLPAALRGTITGNLMCRDRHALLVIDKAGAPASKGSYAAAVLAVLGGLGLTRFVVHLAPSWVDLVVWGILFIEILRLTLRSRRRGHGLQHYVVKRIAAGDDVRTGSLYAAHPAGLRHGRLLVDEVLTHVPSGVRLVIQAANEALAKNYIHHHGFTRVGDETSLILEWHQAEGVPQ